MPESIEAFVKKLQSEGVAAGKEAAEKITADARREADRIVGDARSEADKIVAKAKSEAEGLLSKGQMELELAVRDTILKLRELLDRALTHLLFHGTENQLADPNYLGEVIREAVAAYARADAGRVLQMKIDIPVAMRDKLTENALTDLFQNLKDPGDPLKLQASLSKAGFEYRIGGATVEVSADSVSEVMAEMVSPALQKIIERGLHIGSNGTPEGDG